MLWLLGDTPDRKGTNQHIVSSDSRVCTVFFSPFFVFYVKHGAITRLSYVTQIIEKDVKNSIELVIIVVICKSLSAYIVLKII